MYSPSKRLLKKGEICSRDAYFNERGYEYSLKAENFEAVLSSMEQWVSAEGGKSLAANYTKKGNLMLSGIGWRFSLMRDKQSDGNVRLVGAFIKWQNRYNNLQDGDGMNRMLTALERCILKLDPAAWIREIPVDRHLTNRINDVPQLWEATQYDETLTEEQAEKKKMKSCLLADYLRGMGAAIIDGAESGTAPNPLLVERMADNERYVKEAAQKAQQKAEAHEQENARRAAAGEKSLEEEAAAKAEEKRAHDEKYPTLRAYPFLFLVHYQEELHPYIHAEIDSNKELLPEPEDGKAKMYRLNGIKISKKSKNAKDFETVLSDLANKDYDLYVTDSRIAVINGKYNKDKSAGWIGFGAVSTMIAEGINLAGRAVRAGMRAHKALAGHLRYEWFARIMYNKKQKFMDSEYIRVIYYDLEKTEWMVDLYLNPREVEAEFLANDMLHRAAVVRNSMTDKKDTELQEFLQRILQNGERIPVSKDSKKLSNISFPNTFYATKAADFRNMQYLEKIERLKQERAQQQTESTPAPPTEKSEETKSSAELPAAQPETLKETSKETPKEPPKETRKDKPPVFGNHFCCMCGTAIDASARFCKKCGHPTGN